MKFKALIFDMDGTIIDSSHIWTEVTYELIRSKGVVITPELKSKLDAHSHGLAMDKVCELIKELTSIADPVEQLIAQKTQLVCDVYRKGIKFIDGFEQFHSQVVDYKLKNGIATNADDATLNITKEMLKIERFFGKHIYNVSCVNNICKPDPALYLYTAKQLSVAPEHCIAIEDSAHGIKAAKSAGMYCIGINTAGNYEQLKESDIIVDSYSDINLKDILKVS